MVILNENVDFIGKGWESDDDDDSCLGSDFW